jgi:uncharacterized protein (TIGR02453 family)
VSLGPSVFLGFPGAQAFLADLAAHNERTWFQANKARYEAACKAPTEAFVEEIRPRIDALAGRPMGAKVFRIHRDVRFSKDKSPYNTHIHIGFQAPKVPGQPRRRGGFYFGLEADKLTLGVGAFDFGPADLERYRKAVAGDAYGEELTEILAGLEAKPGEPDLKRVPAPYPAGHPRGELLRHKGLNVWQDLAEPALIASPDLADAVMAAFEAMDPVNLWLTEVLEEA